MTNPFSLIFRSAIPVADQQNAAAGKHHPVYTEYRFRAEGIKILLQMVIGVCLTSIVIWKLLYRVFGLPSGFWRFRPDWLLQMKTLDLVGHALAYSSAIELAYTLFTPGPDEAVEPVLMGMAAGMLLAFSNIDSLDTSKAGATILSARVNIFETPRSIIY